MKIERTKNATRNIIFGFILKIYQLLLPFIFRTVIIQTIGIEYLGLNSLFSSILQVLNLAELGVGSAMIYSMYSPIANDNADKICSLMKLYRTYYRIIGIVILVMGLLLVPVLPDLIKSDLPESVNLYVLYFMNLLATVLSYWLFAYKNSILTAHQRTDISSRVSIVTDTCKYALQFVSLIYFKNYYYFMMSSLMVQIPTNLTTAYIADRMFPDYKPRGDLDKDEVRVINKRVRDLFTSKIGGTIVSSADTIVISAYLGLYMLAVYQNYYYIMSAVMAFMTIIYSSITAGVGNGLITKSDKENYKDFRILTFMVFWILCFSVCAFLCLYQPFMELWMGKDKLLPGLVVVLLCIYFLGYEIVMFLSLFKDAGGIWHEDRFRPLISGLVNLTLNICLVRKMGIYGIVLSTILSVWFISIPWIIINVMTLIYKRNIKDYVAQIVQYISVIIFAAIISGSICCNLTFNPQITLLINGVVSIIIPNFIFYCVFRKRMEFKATLEIIKRMISRKGSI